MPYLPIRTTSTPVKKSSVIQIVDGHPVETKQIQRPIKLSPLQR